MGCIKEEEGIKTAPLGSRNNSAVMTLLRICPLVQSMTVISMYPEVGPVSTSGRRNECRDLTNSRHTNQADGRRLITSRYERDEKWSMRILSASPRSHCHVGTSSTAICAIPNRDASRCPAVARTSHGTMAADVPSELEANSSLGRRYSDVTRINGEALVDCFTLYIKPHVRCVLTGQLS